MAGIDISGVTKTYGGIEVLRQIELNIKPGEFMTLVGPSGCGKSTLLRIVAGLEFQCRGTVSIGGRAVDNLRPRDRDLAMVFQSYALYPHLTVAQNIAVPLRMRRLNSLQRLPLVRRMLPGGRRIERDINREVQTAAAMLGIDHLLARKPGQLSGGQRQRVALGRAMVRHPKAFLMDEPLSNLDAKLRVHMRAEIAQLHRQLGATFLYVTHDQAEAMTMSDRIAVMMDGAMLQVDTPDVVYNDPKDLRVAEFIGSPKINVLATAVNPGGALAVDERGRMPALLAVPDQKVHLAFRPEHAALADPERAQMRGHVAYLENLGSDLLVHIRVGDADQPRMVVRTAPNGRRYEIGENIGIDLSVKLPLLFDEQGKRIHFVSSGDSSYREVACG